MATAARMRVYADTSVFGGVFDDEFREPSRIFFDCVRQGRFELVISTVLRDELKEAPDQVLSLFDELRVNATSIDVTEEALRLQQAYLDAGIVTSKWEADALHVALATVSGCRVIVSWNFRHIVNFQKIPLYNGVNLVRGYGAIGIHSPQEVTGDEDEDENI